MTIDDDPRPKSTRILEAIGFVLVASVLLLELCNCFQAFASQPQILP